MIQDIERVSLFASVEHLMSGKMDLRMEPNHG
jgi:hypothetical protein